MLVVLNPAAGRRNRHRLRNLLAAMASRGVVPVVRETTGPSDATALAEAAARSGVSLVVAAGGDGTVSEVVNGLWRAGTGAALGIVPLGTANVLAHELALPRSPDALAALLVAGRTRPVWHGVIAQEGVSRAFVQMVGAGFDAEVVRRVDTALKRRIGGLAYAWQGVREALRYRFPPLEVTIDGVATASHGIIVTKGRCYAGRYTLPHDASPFEPDFRVVLFDRPGAMAALGFGLALPPGLVHRMPGVRLLPGRHVRVSGAGVPVQVDGDAIAVGGFEVCVATRPLAVVTP